MFTFKSVDSECVFGCDVANSVSAHRFDYVCVCGCTYMFVGVCVFVCVTCAGDLPFICVSEVWLVYVCVCVCSNYLINI